MAKSADKTEVFETLPVKKAILAMAIPSIISQLINLIYNLADAFYIGRTGNPDMVAGVSVASTLFIMTVCICNLFGMGGGSLMARLIGRRSEEEARRVCAYSLMGAVVVALGYSLLLGLIMKPLLMLMGASEVTYVYARHYLLPVVVLGGLPTILGTVASHLLRNVGYAKKASLGLSAGGVLNILLDPLFMFVIMPDGKEVLGAGLATLISNTASCIFLCILLVKASAKAPLSASPKDAARMTKESRRELYGTGIPTFMLTFLFDMANIVLNALMSGHGDLSVAALGIVMKVERIPNALNLGLCQGMMPIVAYNFASGNRARMEKIVKTARKMGLLVSAAAIALLFSLAKPAVRLFMSTGKAQADAAAETVRLAMLFLRIRCFASPFQFLNYHSSFSMQAMGFGKGTLLHAIGRELVFYIPFMFLLNALFGSTGLVTALIVGEGCGALLALWLYKRGLKEKDSAAQAAR